MPHRARAVLGAGVALASLLAYAAPAAAQSVADFYKGRTITILMGTGPGGSYDLYGRTIAEHLGRHIPGQPLIIVEHMPGAGGVNAGNHIFGPGPQDGSKILLSHALPLVEKLEPRAGVRFESRRFQWLGAYDSIAQMMALWHTSGATTLDDLKSKDLVIGSFNKTHLSYQWAMLTKDALGATYKVITGYPSGNHLNLAMERGEIHGWTVSWENLVGTKPEWLRDKKVSIPVQYTIDRLPDLKDVPTLIEIAPPGKKDVAEFITFGTPFARALAVGPGVPADRVAALRQAFDGLMKDKAFLDDAHKRKLDINPRDAKATQALVEKIAAASPDLVARVRKTIGQDD
jgi:tripartite-type tricarboxylate transporter receptor subunit TctC